MNQSKKILAALVAVPASVVVADGAMAAEETETKVQTLEFKNDFIGSSTYSTQKSSKEFVTDNAADLKKQILIEMSKYTKGFTITYTGAEVATYKTAVEEALNKEFKGELNTSKTVSTTSGDTATFDTTELYGTYNNMRVKATETLVGDTITAVKLEFSVNYFGTISNGASTDLADAKARYAKDLKEKVEAATSDVAKVKIIHDYVVQSTRYVANNHTLRPTSGLSSHGYALWMYVLLKEALPGTEMRYVYGVADGEYHSWNIIKLGGKWYHLDAASDDTAIQNDKLIKYHHFLTYKQNEKRIDVGADKLLEIKDSTYNYFLTADNQAQSSTHLYYADAETSGELSQINLSTLVPESLGINKDDATSGKGQMVYYEHTSGDTAEVVAKTLYFINDSQGKYLYSYNLWTKEPRPEKLQLILKEQLASISLIGSTLKYETLKGESRSLPLSYLDKLDQQYADEVIKAIEKLEASVDQTTDAFKKAVADARKLFMALTENQKELVRQNGALKTLEQLEQAIEPDISIKAVIDLINGLDEMADDYVLKVEEAASNYKDLVGDTEKSKVYNYAILKEAEAKVNEAEKLNDELKEKLKGLEENENPFEKFPDFIVFMENFFKKYDSYLPSIRKVFTDSPESSGAISEYRLKVVEYRTETQNFINLVKVSDENDKDFLGDMEEVREQYNNLLASQLYLISDADKERVQKKLATAKKMQQQFDRFNELMGTIASDDVGKIELTKQLISDMREAQKLYDEMKEFQKEVISAEVIRKLKVIIERINNYTDNKSLKTLIGNVEALDILKMATLDELIAAVTSADTTSIVMKEMGIIEESKLFDLLSEEIVLKLQDYRTLAKQAEAVAKPLQKKMAELTDESTKDDVKAIRDVYEKLEPKLKVFLKEELKKLEKHELRWKNADLAEKAKGVIDKINALSDKSTFEEVKAVFDEYQALDPEVQALVTNSQKLLDLWGKVSADAEAYQKAIDAVNKAIKDLSDKSTREEIQKVIDAYNLLTGEQKAKVINYEKIEELLSKLGEKEQGELDQIAANKVKELISALSNESTAVEIAEARAAYETLSAGAKALITDKVLEVLKFYESRLTELSEQAKKEAAVVQDRIDRITSNYTEAQIKNIRIAYNALSQLAKEYVTNLQKLIDAENSIIYENTVVKQAKLDANAFDVYMNDITRNSTQAEIAKARAYYNNLSTEAKKHVTTYEKLVRLETMWKDPKYIELVYTYYPDYIHDIKPGGIVIEKPKYDSIYIPDDSETDSPSSSYTPSTDWTTYDTMKYQNGRYTASITTTQAQSIKDRSKILKADDIEIVLPTADLDAATATVGVTVSVTNNQLNIQFKQGKQAKTFSEYVEIHVPFNVLNGNASQIIERVSESNSSASFKIEGSSFIIRTKTSGTFKATATPVYSDLPNNAQGTAMRELAKRGILFEAKPRLSQSYKQVTKFEVASMMATALGLSSASQSSYQDVTNERDLQQVQGLLEAGIVSGFTSSYFNGEGAVTKQEAAIMIANMYRYLNRDVSRAYSSGFQSSFKDVTYLSLEARQSIAILELFGVVNGADSFGPTKELTRGEFAELFYNALKAIDYL